MSGLLCIGYRDEAATTIGFPGQPDHGLRLAVEERLKRLALTDPLGAHVSKSTRRKEKPFWHSYTIRQGRAVLCVHERTFDLRRASEIIDALYETSRTGVITEEFLRDIARSVSFTLAPQRRRRAAPKPLSLQAQEDMSDVEDGTLSEAKGPDEEWTDEHAPLGSTREERKRLAAIYGEREEARRDILRRIAFVSCGLLIALVIGTVIYVLMVYTIPF